MPYAIVLFYSVLLSSLSVVFAGAAELPDTVKQIRSSIVAVGTYQKTRRPPADFRGTGFAVGNGNYIMTNAHVLPKTLNTTKNETLVVFVGHGKDVEARPAQIVAMDVEHDLALLRMNGIALPFMRLGNSQHVREGQSVAFTGFPIGTVLGLYPATHRGIIAAITPIAIPAGSSQQLDPALIQRLRNPYDVFQLDATAYPGNSGSPLYDPSTGWVLGVINMVFVKGTKENALSQPSGITYAIPGQYVQALLKQAGIAPR